jgi:Flp pilus assembly protein TadG
MRVSKHRKPCRSGLAALELTLCLPMLCFVTSLVFEYGRLFHDVAIVQDCARNGALHACGLLSASPFASVNEAVQANAYGLKNPETLIVATTSGTDSNGNAYCEVAVTYTFEAISPYPGIPDEVTFTRKLRMAKAS